MSTTERNALVKRATELMGLACDRRDRNDATWRSCALKAAGYLEDAGLRAHAAKIRRECR